MMLGASKVFDHVQYCKLFIKLIDRNLPLAVIRFILNIVVQGGPKNRTVLRVDNFATGTNRKACNMSKACKFCPEKSIKLACQCI